MLKKIPLFRIACVLLILWLSQKLFCIKKDQLCDKCLELKYILAEQASELDKKLQRIQHITDVILREIINLKLSLGKDNLNSIDEYFSVFVKLQYEIAGLKNRSEELKNETGRLVEIQKTTKKAFLLSNQSSRDDKMRYSCDETYKGSLYGYPLYKVGFVRKPCKRISLKDSVTLLLIFPSFSSSESWRAVFSMFKRFYVIAKKKDVFPFFNIPVHYLNEQDYLGQVLNKIIKSVSTPYILFARHLYRLDYSLDIERLIHIHENTGAEIVSGSRKSRKNEWDRGCYQALIKLYTLEYKVGYFYSEKECLKCSFTDSPFLASINLFRSEAFDNNLKHGVFNDFFVNLNVAKRKVLVCPDVMFYSDQHTEKDFQLSSFASKWDIKKIISTTKVVMWFGCRKGYNHTTKQKCTIGKGMAVPPCCIANLIDAVKFLVQTFTAKGIKYLVLEGSVLGLVKFLGILPWERDFDIAFLSEQFDAINKTQLAFNRKGYQLIVDELPMLKNHTLTGGVFHVRANGWSIQLYGQQTLSTNETVIQALNESFVVPENPGLYLRNRYGKEIYQHAEHWMILKHNSSWESYLIKNFSKCSIPNHHACLDQFPSDGDLIFKN